MSTHITQNELDRLAASRSLDEWDELTTEIERARGGHRPSDWYEKVVESGLLVLTRVRLGDFLPAKAAHGPLVTTPDGALTRTLECTEHGVGAWFHRYGSSPPESADIFTVGFVFTEIAELLGCTPAGLLRRMADVWEASDKAGTERT